MLHRSRIALAAVGLLACKDPPGNQGEKASASASVASPKVVVSASGKPSAVASASAAKPSAAEQRKPRELTEAEKALRARYHAALDKGRAATREGRYDDAVAAFDDALAVHKDDARALTERGYAYLLAKKYPAAVFDLERARGRAKDRVLAAQVYYNLGLAYEGLALADESKRAFAKSVELHPTDAAKKKLAEPKVCTVAPRFDRPAGAAIVDDWRALAHDWAEGYNKVVGLPADFATPATDAEAKGLLCADCAADGPAVALFPPSIGQKRWRLVVPRDGGRLLAFDDDDDGMFGRCAWQSEFTKIERKGDLVRVEQRSAPQEMVYVKTDAKGQISDCNAGDAACMTACFAVSTFVTTHVFDVKAQKRVAIVEQSSPPGAAFDWQPPVTVDVDANTRKIMLAGGGCDGAVAIVDPAH